MSPIRNFSRKAYLATVVLALAFGARQAVARTPTTCDPPLYAGTCDSGTNCDERCFQQNGEGWFGICSGGCCACYM
jgi:hypothetical protein